MNDIPEKLPVTTPEKYLAEKEDVVRLFPKLTTITIPLLQDLNQQYKFTFFDWLTLLTNTLIEGNLIQKESVYMLKQIILGDHSLTSWLGLIIGFGQWAVDWLSTNTFNWKSFLAAVAIYVFGRSSADGNKTGVQQ